MAKDCGNTNSMLATNFKERTDAMWAQNEWMRHRFAISSGIATDQPDGTMKEVQILNLSGTQPQVGDDMLFYIDGINTNLMAKYNLNNKHNDSADCLTTAIADYIYTQQTANGVNMNDTGVNSAEKPVLVPGAKGAEAIAVNGYWYIITPYVSRPSGNNTMDYNVCDSPAVYYVHSLQGDLHIIGDRELHPIWVNKSIITGLVNYLRTNEERDSDIPSLPSGYCWSAVRLSSSYAWYVYLGFGIVASTDTYSRCTVFPASDLDNECSKWIDAEDDCYKNKHSSIDAASYHFHLSQLRYLIDRIKNGYKPTTSICFVLDYPVYREVFAANYADRIVHHYVAGMINKVCEQAHADNGNVSHGNRIGYSTLTAHKQIQDNIKEVSERYTKPCFVATMDIKGFFMSIDQQMAYDIFLMHADKYYNESDKCFMLNLVKILIFHNPTSDCERRSPIESGIMFLSIKAYLALKPGKDCQ